MNTTVSMPDETLRRADRAAQTLGVSRSEFVARAIERYADELERNSLTNHIDMVLERAAVDDGAAQAVVGAGRATLSADSEAW
ncbi:CopG family transcriptional regulator [Arthrobacter crystallopoietes BAB-32]|uniref:CopG family transcriptional regulator n=1 Tax=Arthrobacter crystallopoietes BAB-32 TaxID=1246476 RepID=N1V7L8_9MICC|nr:ribbon-helix-helix domain-containing protein [Arthrobacter crystallopoietes]EMY36107.1 CopG family transcriptional regulator [Arthrobacter crystallopoietes BAB-32]